MEIVPSTEADPLVIVDYAHTPDALEGTLREARALAGQRGQVIVVFGCGGDRDAEKRPIMGQIASTLADVVVITTDNPRSEQPDVIVGQILSGVDTSGDVRVEEDRNSALAAGISTAGPDDVVVIAGKGHETTQIIGERTVAFDDRSVAASILAGERPC
jgi:folylpolyglutamate synthase/dihydropteroate synthase